MKLLIFCVFCLFFVGVVVAQPSIQWQKTLGGTLNDEARCVQQITDGGFIVAGYTVSDDGDIEENYGFFDIWVIRFDSLGVVKWKRNYGGSNHDGAYAIQQTLDGGFVLTGVTESNDDDVIGNHGGKDAWVLKLDSSGGIQWQKCLGGSGWDEAWDIQLTLDGGYILAGRSSSTDGDVTGNHGALDFWVVRLDISGEIEWQKSLGGSDYDFGYSIYPTSDGGYIVAGESQSIDGDITGNPGGLAAWVVKLNFEGKIEWQKAMGGSYIDRANEILQTREGGYIVFGQTDSNDGDVSGNHGGSDLWAVKLSDIGIMEWQRALGGSSEDYGTSICQTNDGGFIMTGLINSINGDVTGNHGGGDLWVVKLSETGVIQWQKALGGTKLEFGYSIRETNDYGFIVAGYAWSNNGDVSGVQGKSDFWIIKLSSESSPTSEVETQALQVYPNPAKNTLYLNIPASSGAAETQTLSVQITDFLGRVLSHQTISLDQSIDLSALPNGLYLLSAITPDGVVFSGKFSKQN